MPLACLGLLPQTKPLQRDNALLGAMLALPPEDGLRRWAYHCFFGLLAVTGLKFHEAVGLRREDVDLGAGVLTLRDTKFGKPRLVPVHPTTCAVLQAYAERCDISSKRHVNPLFLVGERDGRLHHAKIHRVFIVFCHATGLRQPGDRKGPRVHDLRHSYAVRTLVR